MRGRRIFVALWASHKDVTLTFNSKDGKAKINMELELGEHDAYFSYDKSTSNVGFARQRRREKHMKEKENTVLKETLVNTNETNDNLLESASSDMNANNDGN